MPRPSGRFDIAGLSLGLLLLGVSSAGVAATAEGPFLAENQAAMARMMAGMDVRPSGDVDRDFTAMMIPHHQGAIDMAQAELRYGRNQHLLRIAQEIIVDQQQEIAAMRLAQGEPLPPSLAAPDQIPGAGSATMPQTAPQQMPGMAH